MSLHRAQFSMTDNVTVIKVQLRDETLADIDDYAEAAEMPRSKVIEHACQNYISQHESLAYVRRLREHYQDTWTHVMRYVWRADHRDSWRVW